MLHVQTTDLATQVFFAIGQFFKIAIDKRAVFEKEIEMVKCDVRSISEFVYVNLHIESWVCFAQIL